MGRQARLAGCQGDLHRVQVVLAPRSNGNRAQLVEARVKNGEPVVDSGEGGDSACVVPASSCVAEPERKRSSALITGAVLRKRSRSRVALEESNVTSIASPRWVGTAWMALIARGRLLFRRGGRDRHAGSCLVSKRDESGKLLPRGILGKDRVKVPFSSGGVSMKYCTPGSTWPSTCAFARFSAVISWSYRYTRVSGNCVRGVPPAELDLETRAFCLEHRDKRERAARLHPGKRRGTRKEERTPPAARRARPS